ncbi:MAG: hypothetical protein E7050_04785 [Lentisphaerae bacterium]|nr:hypothetical protein [Lentisphaerota bacterium]
MNLSFLSVKIPDFPSDLTVCRSIGHGAAGDVWLVKDVTGKYLAAKIINTRWHNMEYDAVCALRALPSHPALVQIYQTGTMPDGNFFYAMELADNISSDIQNYIPDTLAQRIIRQKMECREILTVMNHIAGGVKHLHDHNLFHGDIKPENIIFINGKAKLADFGMISNKTSGGTAGFVPDEPLSGSDRDCYALGKTLYCLWSKLDVAEFPALPEKFSAAEAKIIRPLYLQACSNKQAKRFSSVENFLAALIAAEKNLLKPSGKFLLRITVGAGIAVAALLSLAIIIFSRSESNKQSGKYAEIAQLPVLPDIENVYYSQVEEIKFRHAVSMARDRHKTSQYFTGEFKGFPDFRELFEKACRDIPQYLEPDEVKWARDFYRKADEFIQVRTLLDNPKLTDKEFLQIYEDNDYDNKFTELSKISGELFRKNKKREYFLTLVIRNNTRLGIYEIVRRYREDQSKQQ